MGVLRHIVFPTLRLLVWAVIAVALCVLAFGGGRDALTAGQPTIEPGVDLTESTVDVAAGDITSSIDVTGTVATDPAATVKSTATGVVRRIHHDVGDAVTADDALLDVLVRLEPTPETRSPPPTAP